MCVHSPFVEKYHNQKVTGDLPITNNNSWRNIFCKGLNYRESNLGDLEKAKPYILSKLEGCFENCYSKHDIYKFMFAEWVNKVKAKINNGINILNSTLHKHKHKDSPNSPDTKRFVVVLKQFNASLIAKGVRSGLHIWQDIVILMELYAYNSSYIQSLKLYANNVELYAYNF